jgi:transcriptional regulator with XRE-family HTH domain
MEVRTFPDALKAIMANNHWTQSDLARELGVSQVWVSEVSRGKKDTTITKAIGLLARVGWEVRISPRAEEPVQRREFMTAAASVIFVPSHKPSPYQDAEYVTTVADSLARNRYELGGVPLAPAAMSHISRIEKALDGTRDAALHQAASGLANQAALILYDAGKLAAADRASAFSLDYAVRANDVEGQARGYEGLSRISLYRGDFSRAVSYAERGLRLTHLSNSQRAALYMRLGRSLALVPDQRAAARAALDQARTVGGLSPFGEAALIGDVGIGLGHLRVHREAASLLSRAAEQIGQWSPLFQAQYLGRQIQTSLRAADPASAADRMSELARALPFVASARVNQRVREILATSAQWLKVPEIREAREHLRSVAVQEA